MYFKIALISLFLLAGCVSVPPSAPPPPIAQPLPPPPPTPVPQAQAENWLDRPITTGNWELRRDAFGSFATFGKPGANPQFLVRCVFATKAIKLSRAGRAPENGSGSMTVRAADSSKTYSVANDREMPAYASVTTPASDPQLDAIAFSRGRFLVSLGGTSDLVIPDWPEFSRVIEDCRG